MRIPLAGPAVLLAAGLAVSGCSSGSGGGQPAAATTPAPSASADALPGITEAFTELPCPAHPPQTTLQMEGCAEHRIVALDQEVSAAARTLYASIHTAIGRRRLVRSQTAWLARRHAVCTRASSGYAGGSLSPVAFANCEVRMDRARLAMLAALTGASSP